MPKFININNQKNFLEKRAEKKYICVDRIDIIEERGDKVIIQLSNGVNAYYDGDISDIIKQLEVVE